MGSGVVTRTTFLKRGIITIICTAATWRLWKKEQSSRICCLRHQRSPARMKALATQRSYRFMMRKHRGLLSLFLQRQHNFWRAAEAIMLLSLALYSFLCRATRLRLWHFGKRFFYSPAIDV